MALIAGRKLRPYQIQSPLGAGGMGGVYRASDLRLERSVAIRVLPAHHPVTPSVRARFEHEAESISALQHPKPPFQTFVFFPGDGGIFLRTLSLAATSSLDAHSPHRPRRPSPRLQRN